MDISAINSFFIGLCHPFMVWLPKHVGNAVQKLSGKPGKFPVWPVIFRTLDSITMSKNKREPIKDPFHAGDKLRLLRESHKYTLERAADELRIGKTTLGDYEQGVSLPPRDVLERAAAFYHVDLGLFYSPEHLSFNLHHNHQANGYVNEQHNTDKQLLERFFSHIQERDARLEELLARAIDRLGGKV